MFLRSAPYQFLIFFKKVSYFVMLFVLYGLGVTAQSNTGAAANFFPLYVSKQTTEKSLYKGDYQYSTKENESGYFQFTSSDNLVANIGPNIVFGENETKTWYGSVSAAVIKAPEPGQSANANLMGTLTLNYRADSKDPDALPLLPVVKKTNINFVIYSVKAEIIAPDSVCAGEMVNIKTIGYPNGGKFVSVKKYQGTSTTKLINDGFANLDKLNSVTISGGLTNGAGANSEENIKIYQDILLVYKYQIEGVSYKATKYIKVKTNGAEKKLASSDAKITDVFKPFMDRLNQTLEVIPGLTNADVSPLNFTTTERQCCSKSAGTEIQKVSNSDVKSNIAINNTPIKGTPFKGKVNKRVSKFGYSFEVDGNYTTSASIKGGASGNAMVVEDGCKKENCSKASADVKVTSNYVFNLKGTLYLLDGYGKRKKEGRTDFNIISPEIPVKYRGYVQFNTANCTGGLRSHLSSDATTLIFTANMGGYQFTAPIDILPAMEFKTDNF